MLYSQQIPWLLISCGQTSVTCGKPHSKNLGDRTQFPGSDFKAYIPLKIFSTRLLSQYLLGHLKTIAEIPLVSITHALRASILQQKSKTVKIKNQ